MGFFNDTITGPDAYDIKITIENIQAHILSSKYSDGVDAETCSNMIGDLYMYILGKKHGALSLPAPALYPSEKYDVMWPEGSRVRSRRGSNVSASSHKHGSSRRDPLALDRPGNSRAYSGASSVTSTSKYSSRYIGIVEDDEDEAVLVAPPDRSSKREPEVPRRHSKYSKHSHSQPKAPGTMRLSNAAVRPTPSMERFMKPADDPEDDDDEPRRPIRQPNRKNTITGFADDSDNER